MATITQFYLEKCRSRLSARLGKEATDYQLSKILDISTSAMSNYTKKDREADDDAAYKIAQYAQVPPMEIIGAIHAKKAKNEDTKNFWNKVSKGAVAGFSGVVLSGSLMSSPAPAQASEFNIFNGSNYILCELKTKIRRAFSLSGFVNALSSIFNPKGQLNGTYA